MKIITKIHSKSCHGFTLVELLVIIVILSILWVIAFVSMQEYAQNARNSKIVTDIRVLSSAIENGSTAKGWGFFMDLVLEAWAYGNAVSTGTFWWGVDISSVSYEVGKINFPLIRQVGPDFTDPEWNEYIVSVILDENNDDNLFYQVAGQTKNINGSYDASVKWNYVKIIPTDIDWLIAGSDYGSGITQSSKNMPPPWIF